MAYRYLRWCPNGCGKRCGYIREWHGNRKIRGHYLCSKCGNTFTVEEVKRYNGIS